MSAKVVALTAWLTDLVTVAGKACPAELRNLRIPVILLAARVSARTIYLCCRVRLGFTKLFELYPGSILCWFVFRCS